MTEPLYLDLSDDCQFEATVERVVDDRVVLDRTLFYPEGGGQPADAGALSAEGATWRVTDVQKRDTIYHAVDGDPPAEGTVVTGELDWERRYAHMRYHTAQHLLSALLLEEYDAETTGNQLYADRARIDCGYDRFTETDLADVTARMNELIDRSLPVEWYELDRDEAEATLDPERTRIHLLPDSITEVRIVEVSDYDRTACAGTHVSNTDEIGEFRATGRETKGPEEERLSFELVS
ncbi:alanyl-tRNA editing protein [Halostella sp. JP-L12]|uniref:alanyl-tRNA editing protein n=1 Tax=Halostella TaxID=1843185 RepID=UPI000EF83011|nr:MULTISPECIES: alanyl-tRNA editing protein [Halostella]NHN47593.1 alanyl-tRNA editing protein [Halostella sp. JP-L12]